MDQMSVFDLAILAETEYRRERLARSYGRGAPAPLRAAVRRVARLSRPAVQGARARRAVERLGTAMDAVAARTDARAWDQQVTRRTAEISDALVAMRPQDGAGRRVA